jgi:hypothetical protein
MPRFKVVRRARSGVAPAFYNIPTPVLTENTDPAGSAPTFTITVSGYPIGLFWNLQVAGDSGFTTALSGEGAVRNEERIVTVTDLTDDDLDATVESDTFEEMVGLPLGATFIRLRLGRESDDGLSTVWGTWSNTISETISALTASQLDAAAKSTYMTLSGGNLVATNSLTNVGQPGFARADSSRTGKRYLEATITAIPTTACYVGVGPSGFNWTVGTTLNWPGTAGSTAGATINSAGQVHANGSSTSSVTSAWAITDIIMVCFDEADGKIWFGRNGSWNGDPSAETGGFTVTGMDVWYAFVGMTVKSTDQRSMTVNFGATAFTYSLPTGADDYT